MRVTSNGPSTIPGILNVHKDLIDQAAREMSVEATSPFTICEVHFAFSLPSGYPCSDRPGPDAEHESDGWIRLEKESQRQNILIIRTRDEDGLSKPINFEDIRMHALPLARVRYPAGR